MDYSLDDDEASEDASMPPPDPEAIASILRFDRSYRTWIADATASPSGRGTLPAAEARVLCELARRVSVPSFAPENGPESHPPANRKGQRLVTATHLGNGLGLDVTYVSRTVRALERKGLVVRRRSRADRRKTFLSLSDEGLEILSALESATFEAIGRHLGEYREDERRRLLRAMNTMLETIVRAPLRPADQEPFRLRPHRSGDLGWIVHRHAILYNREYGWGEAFEAQCAEFAMHFLRDFDRTRECCWIAEMERAEKSAIVGSVFVVRHPKLEDVALLRLLLVEPDARGLGIGRRLVQECVGFAREAGYRRISLWTASVLHAARAIYEREGFRLTAEEPFDGFGTELTGETWELEL